MVMPSNTFATYHLTQPPMQLLHTNTKQIMMQIPATYPNASSTAMTSEHCTEGGKENVCPNRLIKRQSEGSSLRQILKRCRGTNSPSFSSNLSAEEECHQNVSIDLTDSTGDQDISAEAGFQPRNQP
ncbi:hypothetical protein CsatB_004206 [Cannabis sativa]